MAAISTMPSQSISPTVIFLQPVNASSEYLDPKSAKYKKMIDWIAKDLGVTSLRYQLLDDMVKAIGLPKDKLCLYCWTGKGFQKSLNSYQVEKCVAR